MPAYNFKERFAAAVQRGDKRQTIRRTDKGARPGSTAYLYTGQRTSKCRLLGTGTITHVLPIELGRTRLGAPYAMAIDKDGCAYLCEIDRLAKEDGFQTAEEMLEWFEGLYGLPFTGYLHTWEPAKGKVKTARQRKRLTPDPTSR